MIPINMHIQKNSFWQSRIWQTILLNSNQCESVHMIQISKGFLGIEIRKIGMGFLGAFILGSTFDLSEKDIETISDFIIEKNCLFFQIEPLFGNVSSR